jgi:glycerol uptake facilitator-like aquaporin
VRFSLCGGRWFRNRRAHLSPGDVGIERLENAAASAGGLFFIILMIGPISGAHLNPVVSMVNAAFGGLAWRDAIAYLSFQVSAASAERSSRISCSQSLQ